MISVGSDCAGIDACIIALRKMKVKHQHRFSCEIDAKCRDQIMANTPPELMFNNMLTRNVKDVPYVDLMVTGFPCQTWSNAGTKKRVRRQQTNSQDLLVHY